MQNRVDATAKRFGVLPEVLDLIDREFLAGVIEVSPDVVLLAIMVRLSQEYRRHGLDGIRENKGSLQRYFQKLKQLYD
jgi:hypothetical protein